MKPVLVVEDEAELSEALTDILRRNGYQVRIASTLADARAGAGDAGLVLLDLGLPDGDGLTACGELSAMAPLIVISARGAEVDRVLALELGADDYLAKPFSARELIARCRAVLRRTNSPRRQVVTIVDLELDTDRFVLSRAGTRIELTFKELQLFMELAENPGALVLRRDLADRVWGAELSLVSRSLEVHISSLRAKLGPAPDGGGYIETVHGGGYRLRL